MTYKILTPSVDLKGTDFNLVTRDDSGKNGNMNTCKTSTSFGDCYTWNSNQKEGYFNHIWASCCTDGSVMGPLPTDRTWRFNILFDVVKDIDYFYIGNFNEDTNSMSFLELDTVKSGHVGMYVYDLTSAVERSVSEGYRSVCLHVQCLLRTKGTTHK